jgi:hypothetical protein
MQKSLAFVRGFFVFCAPSLSLLLNSLIVPHLRKQSYTVQPAFARPLRRVCFLVLAASGWLAVMAKRKTEM